MRKYQQAKILELLKTLDEAHNELRKPLMKKTPVNLLADCQNFALQIGRYIEGIAGEGTETVALLQEYCELLLKAANEEIHEKQLRRHLIKIENSVRLELKPDRIEVAFLSYKASMSDSITSIYFEAQKISNCDAYWIPVPYFERNSDGSFGAMHYEGAECYSNKIACTDWRTYDIEARHPDMIFTFAPYDSGNFVTSIHPNFYCERLRNLTDLLVYVPYFVATVDVQEHFCICPGVLYSHKVVVQSKKIRQTYIRLLKEFEKKNHCKGAFGKLEEKIVALGSPKFDMSVNSKREDFVLPDEWKNLIESKKVVLYNTTIGAILKGNEQYLKKVRYVLDLFRKRNDIVIWWRPHPLNEATYQSMRPQLLDEYEQMIAEYKRESFGIFDDTADLHRAIAWSDVYYGDRSSLVALYQAAGKPVMIQNIKVNGQYDFSETAIIVPLAFDGDYIFLNVENFNALLKMNKNTLELEYVGAFPETTNKYPLYRQAAVYHDKMYFAPFSSDAVAEYDISRNTLTPLPYSREMSNGSNGGDFSFATGYGQYIFFTPYRYNAIMRLNTVTGEFDFFDDWVAPLTQIMKDKKEAFFLIPLRTDESTIMLAALGTNAILEFHMDTLKASIHEVGPQEYQYNGICFDGENYWLSPRNDGPVVKWNSKTGIIKEFANLAEGSPENQYCFHPAFFCEGYVWLMPNLSKRAVKINVKTEEVFTAEEFVPSFVDGEPRVSKGAYRFALTHDGVIYAQDGKDGTFIEYHCKTQTKREKIIKYTPSLIKQMKMEMERCFHKDINNCRSTLDCCYGEGYTRTTSEVLDYITNNYDRSSIMNMRNRQLEIFRELNSNADGTAGKEIFAYCNKKSGVM